LDSLW